MQKYFCMCVCVRLKSVIATDNQENDESGNATFFQILISFYTQSEVVSPLYSNLSLSLCLKDESFENLTI